MSRDDADKYMASKALTYKHICIKAKDEYHKQCDKNGYPNVHHAMDSQMPPGNFGANVNVCDVAPGTTLTEAQVHHHQMKGSSSPSSGTPYGNCHNCGAAGHYAHNCPK
jgi:hypothetical protein